MGRALLIVGAAALVLACEPARQDADMAAHADMACVACHQGPTGERGRATVPEASCTDAGCHGDGGPAEVRVGTVAFSHRDHGAESEIELSCAGCHTHAAGDAPLEASVDACALCHIGQVAGSRGEECRVCHERPDHAAFTSQGVVVSHSALPWVEAGCVRCHYDVADPPTEVAASTCRQCHEELDRLNQAGVGRDLHPIHAGVTCTACHPSETHHVRAMSTAVQLVCSDCHRQAHALALEPDDREATGLCGACHDGVHRAQQQLLLGLATGVPAAPSSKFLAGITCRSCHIPTPGAAADPTVPIRGQASACAACHEQEYETVLTWWLDGIQQRLAATGAYVEAARDALAAPGDSGALLLREAGGMVDLVAEAGGQHNLELADRLLRQALDRARRAYGAEGRRAPAPPDLGRVPHSGLCSYCHYGPDEPWDFRAMSPRFHEEILGPR